MAHAGRESPSCNRKKQSKEAQEAGESCVLWWSGRRAANMTEIGEKRREKKERRERREKLHGPLALAHARAQRNAKGAWWCSCSRVQFDSPWSVPCKRVALANATPHTRPATATAHDALARVCEQKGLEDTAASQSSCWGLGGGRRSALEKWRWGWLSEGKNSGSRAGCDLEMSECHWVGGPGPRLGGCGCWRSHSLDLS